MIGGNRGSNVDDHLRSWLAAREYKRSCPYGLKYA
jgi:hypothetical protein